MASSSNNHASSAPSLLRAHRNSGNSSGTGRSSSSSAGPVEDARAGEGEEEDEPSSEEDADLSDKQEEEQQGRKSSRRKRKMLKSVVVAAAAAAEEPQPQQKSQLGMSAAIVSIEIPEPKRKQSKAQASLRLLTCRWSGCVERFESAEVAREHEHQVHSCNPANVVCGIEGCGKSFLTNQKLQRHFVAHLERQFECHVCHKKFLYSWDLKRHEFLHTGDRPFPCPEKGCTRSFTKAVNCEAHVLNDHKHAQSAGSANSIKSGGGETGKRPAPQRSLSTGDVPLQRAGKRVRDERMRTANHEQPHEEFHDFMFEGVTGMGEKRRSSAEESGYGSTSSGASPKLIPSSNLMFPSVAPPDQTSHALSGRLTRPLRLPPPPLNISSRTASSGSLGYPSQNSAPPSSTTSTLHRVSSTFAMYHHPHPRPQYMMGGSGAGMVGGPGAVGNGGGALVNGNGSSSNSTNGYFPGGPAPPPPLTTPSGSTLQQRFHPQMFAQATISPQSSIASIPHLGSHHTLGHQYPPSTHHPSTSQHHHHHPPHGMLPGPPVNASQVASSRHQHHQQQQQQQQAMMSMMQHQAMHHPQSYPPRPQQQQHGPWPGPHKRST